MELKETETVTISKDDLKTLLKRAHYLDALIVVGVKNWEGYQLAVNLVSEQEQSALGASTS